MTDTTPHDDATTDFASSLLDGTDAAAIVGRLVELEAEKSWAEFKENNSDPQEIGEYISALSNSAALEERHRAYLVWGVRDSDHEIVGTKFTPGTARVGQEELENYLTRNLSPQIFFRFHPVDVAEHRLVLLEIAPAQQRPVQFRGEAYIRIGSYKKKLSAHEDHERRLWRLLDARNYENSTAKGGLSPEQLVQLLDYPSYFRLVGMPLPENRSLIIETLQHDGLVAWDVSTDWSITNVGALLLAHDLHAFPDLARKAARVIQYRGNSRVETVREQLGQRGYAAGFQGLVGYVLDLLPESEVIRDSIRRSQSLYPELALRELVANALIHQDLTMTGTGPMVEIFSDRIEITNPGQPLVSPERFIDSPSRSRNELFARLMRKMGICEERGSGWDKVTFEIEYHQLPPPLVETTDDHTRVVLLAPMPFSKMQRDDKLRAVYQHACLKYVNREQMTNATLRTRLGLSSRNTAQVSRLLRDAQDEGLIAPYDPDAGYRVMRYVPFWADPRRTGF